MHFFLHISLAEYDSSRVHKSRKEGSFACGLGKYFIFAHIQGFSTLSCVLQKVCQGLNYVTTMKKKEFIVFIMCEEHFRTY